MKKIAILVLICMSIVGCTKEKKKVSDAKGFVTYSTSGVVKTEKQKAIDWITNNNVWGPSKKALGVTAVVENYINVALKAGANKSSSNAKGSNIYLAFNKDMMKSGKYMMLIWKDKTFSVREMTQKEIDTMKIPSHGLKRGVL